MYCSLVERSILDGMEESLSKNSKDIGESSDPISTKDSKILEDNQQEAPKEMPVHQEEDPSSSKQSEASITTSPDGKDLVVEKKKRVISKKKIVENNSDISENNE